MASQNKQSSIDTTLIVGAAALGVVGSLLVGVAVFLGGSALVSAARQWARQQETPPTEAARIKYTQLKRAATAGVAAGADAWQSPPAS
ncbi:MAG: hypothetical protein ACLPVF_09220 [Acidimicrobiales bacterium]